MIIPQISALYIGFFALTLVFISALVIRARVKQKIVIGDGGNEIMIRYCRAHSNFIEYVPIALLLMIALELTATTPIILHCFGVMLLIGRISHFYSLTNKEPKSAANGKMVIIFRQVGMMITFSCLFVGGIMAIVKFMLIASI